MRYNGVSARIAYKLAVFVTGYRAREHRVRPTKLLAARVKERNREIQRDMGFYSGEARNTRYHSLTRKLARTTCVEMILRE